MKNMIFVLTGGGLGSLARYGVSELATKYLSGLFPNGTFLVNISGSLLIGLLLSFWNDGNVPSGFRLFLFVGFLGGFTTFSSYTLETFNLFKDGQMRIAVINILSNNILGILFVFLGLYIGQIFLKMN